MPKTALENVPTLPDREFRWHPGTDPKSPAALARFFSSAAIQRLKVTICDIGRRMWTKDYVDGNGGNITVRVGDNLVLCTPTLTSKGFMKPSEISLVDLEGKQLAGPRQRTSEALTHLGIMRRQPLAKACVHAHPPHATAFALSSAPPPGRLLTESEIFLGEIGYANYQTPGTPENAGEIGRVGAEHQAVIMANHGVIVWGKDLEDAYWKLEITDTYCRTVWIASQLGAPLREISQPRLDELIVFRKKLGMPDHRGT